MMAKGERYKEPETPSSQLVYTIRTNPPTIS